MIIKNEDLCAEFAARLNDMESEINSILGEDTVKINNNKEMPGCIDIWFNGKLVYDPADQSEAEAYLSGIIDTYKLMKSKNNNQKVFVLVNTYFRTDCVGSHEPIIVGYFRNYESAKKAFDDEKNKILLEETYGKDSIIVEDEDSLWTIQQDDWDDWDSLKIVEEDITESTKDLYAVYKIHSNDETNETLPKFVCISGNEEVAKQAFENEKQIIADEEFGYGEEKSYVSTDTENEWEINSDVYDTWVKLVMEKVN